MFFNKDLCFFIVFLTSFSLNANEFRLSEWTDQEYLLHSPAEGASEVIIDRQASNDLHLIAVLHARCGGIDYRVPVIKGNFETGVSSAEFLEYVIFKYENKIYSPIKSISSYYVIPSDKNESAKPHFLEFETQNTASGFCKYINNKTEYDNPIYIQREK
jgi:hypothetical protein